MAEKGYLIDDRNIIPDDIKNMTKEELEAEIKKFGAEAAEKKKNRITLKTAHIREAVIIARCGYCLRS